MFFKKGFAQLIKENTYKCLEGLYHPGSILNSHRPCNFMLNNKMVNSLKTIIYPMPTIQYVHILFDKNEKKGTIKRQKVFPFHYLI